MLRIGIVIPVYNEEEFLEMTLNSLLSQTYQPQKIVVVNDNSTDGTARIIEEFCQRSPVICSVFRSSEAQRVPGAKIVQAFNDGLPLLGDVDIVCKFDADLIFPPNYLQRIVDAYVTDETLGMFAGVCHIQKGMVWKLENLTNTDHIRGPIKSYRKQCFEQIGGLKVAMGWDTADELLARYFGWRVRTDASLIVKHLRPTAQAYSKKAQFLQGEMFYRLGYGLALTLIASAKLAYKKRKIHLFFEYLQGYFQAKQTKKSLLLTAEQARWVRNYRWKGIYRKIFC